VCGVVWCNGEDWESCALIDDSLPGDDKFGPFNLSGTFSCEAIFPGAMTREKRLIDNEDLEATSASNVYSLKANGELHNLMAAALFGRYYSKDPFFGG